jgi:hypothetical protein
MYANIPGTARGFFERVCRSEDRPLTIRDPPRHLTIRESTSAMASSSKGENGAGDVLPAPLDQPTRLTHKLINVVVEAVVYAVDVA